MAYGTANAAGFASGRWISLSGTAALTFAALVMAAGAAAWIADVGPVVSASSHASSDDTRGPSFEARFSARSAFDPLPMNFSLRPSVQSLYSEVEVKLQEAKARLARKLQSEDWKTAFLEESAASTSSMPSAQTKPKTSKGVATDAIDIIGCHYRSTSEISSG
jgi:hypothetical protein